MKLKENSIALIFGIFMGLWHAFWSLLVLVGLAQVILDFVYGIHFLNNPFTVASFNLVTALTLIVFTSVVGYIAGWVFAIIWNKAHKAK